MAVRGSASIDTGVFGNKQKKYRKKIPFSKLFDIKVDMTKVVFRVMKPWIATQIELILGFEDDIVVNLIFNVLERDRYPDVKDLTVSLMGFLESDTLPFMEKLWKYLIDAQNSKIGIAQHMMKEAQDALKLKKEKDKKKQETKEKQEREKKNENIIRVKEKQIKREIKIKTEMKKNDEYILAQKDEWDNIDWSPSPPPPMELKKYVC